MYFSELNTFDVSNGPGIRVSLFTSGCKGMPCEKYCFNQVAQSFTYGQEWTSKDHDHLLEAMREPYVKGLSILGGEPTLQFRILTPLIHEVKQTFPKKDVWLWTGRVWEDAMKIRSFRELLESADVVVDGPFIPTLASPSLRFRGSSNQRIIDVHQSTNHVKLITKYMGVV